MTGHRAGGEAWRRAMGMGYAKASAGHKRVDAVGACSYFVLMESQERKGDRWLRLGDLAPHEVIVVRCPCGRNTEYRRGYLQRRHRVPSDTLVFDLQYRLRCSHCNRRDGIWISILDERTRWGSFC